MKIYLDNCCFNRPYDDQSSLTVRLETEAKLYIQQSVRAKKIELGWSYILDYENEQNPFDERKIEIRRWKREAMSTIEESKRILSIMNHLRELAIKPLDGLHIACAAESQCDYFITVDKGILRKKSEIDHPIIINPVDFVIELENIE
jgi:predicted nucleic acid-binding protein